MITDNSLRLFSSFLLGNRSSTGSFIYTSNTSAASTTNTSVIDLGYLRDIGEGQDLYMAITITGDSVTNQSAAGAIRFDAIACNLTSDLPDTGTFRTIGSSGQIALTTSALTTGLLSKQIVYVRLNPLGEAGARVAGAGAYTGRTTNLRQYLTMAIIVDSATLTLGTNQVCSVDIVTDIQGSYRAYPSGFTVA
jgi:hypothetical protein